MLGRRASVRRTLGVLVLVAASVLLAAGGARANHAPCVPGLNTGELGPTRTFAGVLVVGNTATICVNAVNFCPLGDCTKQMTIGADVAVSLLDANPSKTGKQVDVQVDTDDYIVGQHVGPTGTGTGATGVELSSTIIPSCNTVYVLGIPIPVQVGTC